MTLSVYTTSCAFSAQLWHLPVMAILLCLSGRDKNELWPGEAVYKWFQDQLILHPSLRFFQGANPPSCTLISVGHQSWCRSPHSHQGFPRPCWSSFVVSVLWCDTPSPISAYHDVSEMSELSREYKRLFLNQPDSKYMFAYVSDAV